MSVLPGTSPSRDSGFTLIELIAVISLLSILCMIVSPNLVQMSDRWMLRTTAYALANDIRRVQSLAIHEGKGYRLDLYTQGFYYLLRSESATALPIKRMDLNPGIMDVSANFRTVEPSYGLHSIQYRSTGSPLKAGTILLKSRSGNQIRLTVEVATGRVLVYE